MDFTDSSMFARDMTAIDSETVTSSSLFVAAVTVYLSPLNPLDQQLALNSSFIVAVSLYLTQTRERLVAEELVVVTVYFQLSLTLVE